MLEGLKAPTSMAIGRGGKLYVTNFGVTAGQGQVLRVVLSEPGGAAGFASLPGTSDAGGAGKDEDGGVLGGAVDVLS